MARARGLSLERTLYEFLGLVNLAGRRPPGVLSLPDAARERSMPKRGVYFFLDPSEVGPDGSPRIVRVGTHALTSGSSSTLRQRLAQHRGRVRSGGGNHRGSIFRLLVGQALLARGLEAPCRSWGIKGSRSAASLATGASLAQLAAAEQPVEAAVSRQLAALQVACVPVEDEPGPNSLRGVIERGAIALLAEASRRGSAKHGPNWLGHWSNRRAVVASGLWNQNHVEEPWSESFIEALEESVVGM